MTKIQKCNSLRRWKKIKTDGHYRNTVRNIVRFSLVYITTEKKTKTTSIDVSNLEVSIDLNGN